MEEQVIGLHQIRGPRMSVRVVAVGIVIEPIVFDPRVSHLRPHVRRSEIGL
jgi:hypothetical protein